MFAAAPTPTTTPGLTEHDNGTKTSDYSDGCNFRGFCDSRYKERLLCQTTKVIVLSCVNGSMTTCFPSFHWQNFTRDGTVVDRICVIANEYFEEACREELSEEESVHAIDFPLFQNANCTKKCCLEKEKNEIHC